MEVLEFVADWRHSPEQPSEYGMCVLWTIPGRSHNSLERHPDRKLHKVGVASW